jgi:hypothetical protein
VTCGPLPALLNLARARSQGDSHSTTAGLLDQQIIKWTNSLPWDYTCTNDNIPTHTQAADTPHDTIWQQASACREQASSAAKTNNAEASESCFQPVNEALRCQRGGPSTNANATHMRQTVRAQAVAKPRMRLLLTSSRVRPPAKRLNMPTMLLSWLSSSPSGLS